jgi:hypothetical protein
LLSIDEGARKSGEVCEDVEVAVELELATDFV